MDIDRYFELLSEDYNLLINIAPLAKTCNKVCGINEKNRANTGFDERYDQGCLGNCVGQFMKSYEKFSEGIEDNFIKGNPFLGLNSLNGGAADSEEKNVDFEFATPDKDTLDEAESERVPPPN